MGNVKTALGDFIKFASSPKRVGDFGLFLGISLCESTILVPPQDGKSFSLAGSKSLAKHGVSGLERRIRLCGDAT